MGNDLTGQLRPDGTPAADPEAIPRGTGAKLSKHLANLGNDPASCSCVLVKHWQQILKTNPGEPAQNSPNILQTWAMSWPRQLCPGKTPAADPEATPGAIGAKFSKHSANLGYVLAAAAVFW